ncbi:MAG: hypothetical protein IJ901_04090 [Bacteroidaceae bacterium]|nr:hypothetical protein [Bacteroidaceae bacterium]
MKKITKLMLALLLCVVSAGVTKVNAQQNAQQTGLADLEAGYGSTSDWQASVNNLSYPIDVKDAVIFGSDANSQVTNANVNNYDYIYFEVTDFSSERAVRVFFWDPNQNKRIDYFLKPEKDKETADYSANTTVTSEGTYCVKIPDGARLQGAKTPYTANGATDPYFKFSKIYLTERETPFVELVPYTLVYSEGKAIIPIAESHIRATGNVSINYSTGEVTNTGTGSLIIYLNKEDLVGATLYHVDTEGSLDPTLQITDNVNGEVGGIYNSRYNWAIANDASRRDKIGAVTAFKYDFSNTGTMTFKFIYILADQLIAGTTLKDIASLPYGKWGAPANRMSQYVENDNGKTNNIDGAAHNDVLYGRQNNGDAAYYVDLTNCSKIIFKGFSSNGVIRLFYNWSGTDNDKPIEVINDFPKTDGTYVFDIDAFKKAKGLTFFHLIGIKSQWADVTLSEVKVEEYTNVISGSGIDRTKKYLANPYLTSIDATGVTATGLTLNVLNPNCLITANAGALSNANNVIVNGTCANLVLTDGHPFAVPGDHFTATSASYTTTINATAQAGTLALPFAAAIPEGVKAYTLYYTGNDKATASEVTSIEANVPVLLNGSGEVTFTGANTWVTTAPANGLNTLVGVYEDTTVPTDDYVLQNGDDGVGFYKVLAEDPITINPFRAYLTTWGAGAKVRVVYEAEDATAITSLEAQDVVNETIYNLNGMRVSHPTKGIYIKNGKKFIVK